MMLFIQVYIHAKPTIPLLPPSLLAGLADAKQRSGFQNGSYLTASHKTALNAPRLSSVQFFLDNSFHSLILLLFWPREAVLFPEPGARAGHLCAFKNPFPHHI